MPRAIRAGDQDDVGTLEERLHRAEHRQRVRPRHVVVGGQHELEDGSRQGLGQADQRRALGFGPTAVVGDEEGLVGFRQQRGDLVQLLGRGHHRVRDDPRSRGERRRAHQVVEGHGQERRPARDGVGEIERAAKLGHEVAGRLHLLRPLDARLGIPRRAGEVDEEGRPLRPGVQLRHLTVGQGIRRQDGHRNPLLERAPQRHRPVEHAEAGGQEDRLGTAGGLVVAGGQAHGEALVATLEVTRARFGAPRPALGQRLPQGRHHGDRGREDAVGPVLAKDVEDHLGAARHTAVRHLTLPAVRGCPWCLVGPRPAVAHAALAGVDCQPPVRGQTPSGGQMVVRGERVAQGAVLQGELAGRAGGGRRTATGGVGAGGGRG